MRVSAILRYLVPDWHKNMEKTRKGRFFTMKQVMLLIQGNDIVTIPDGGVPVIMIDGELTFDGTIQGVVQAVNFLRSGCAAVQMQFGDYPLKNFEDYLKILRGQLDGLERSSEQEKFFIDPPSSPTYRNVTIRREEEDPEDGGLFA